MAETIVEDTQRRFIVLPDHYEGYDTLVSIDDGEITITNGCQSFTEKDMERIYDDYDASEDEASQVEEAILELRQGGGEEGIIKTFSTYNGAVHIELVALDSAVIMDVVRRGEPINLEVGKYGQYYIGLSSCMYPQIMTMNSYIVLGGGGRLGITGYSCEHTEYMPDLLVDSIMEALSAWEKIYTGSL